jgi:asparagine synthase (glutamine-hydrolysing)
VLFCSRDRLGIKPFYYHLDEQRLIFASEIKAVLSAVEPRERQLNESYLARFVIQGLLNDGPETLFTTVKQLLPGHGLEIRRGQIASWRYWDMPSACIARANNLQVDTNEATDEFRTLLTDAIRLQFRADVPVGVSLSGGLDSSTIVALATRAMSAQLSTFTTEYSETDFSEGQYARTVAQTFGTSAHYTTPSAEQYIDFIDRFCWYHDEPCAGPGPFSQWHVMQLAGRHVKVLLEGQGADELLGGYLHYFNPYLTTVLKRVFMSGAQRTTWHQFREDGRAIGRHTQISCFNRIVTMAPFLLNPAIKALFAPAYRFSRRCCGKGDIRGVLEPALLQKAMPSIQPRRRHYHDDLNEELYWELTRDNLPLLLQYGDRTSMAFSVESRVPFLDHRLVEYVGSLPYHLKIRAQTTKFLLREAMQILLPESVVHRPDKKGYPTPFSLWLRGPLRTYTEAIISAKKFAERGIFRPAWVRRVWDEHINGQCDHAWLIWRIINVESWMRVFLDDFTAACARYKNTPH